MMLDDIVCFEFGDKVLLVNSLSLESKLIDKRELQVVRQDNDCLSKLYRDLNETEGKTSTINTQTKISPKLVLSHKCNFACDYCYERDFNKTDDRITPDEVVQIRKFISAYCTQYDIKEEYSAITLIGGEPLLNENYDTIKATLNEWKGNLFTIKTNGTNIQLYHDLFRNEKVEFHISLDGTPNMHFSKRKTNDRFAYEKTLSGIKWALDYEKPVTIMTVYDPNLSDLYGGFFDLLEDFGWGKNDNLKLHFMPLIGNGSDDIEIGYLLKSIDSLVKLKNIDHRTNQVSLEGFVPGCSRFIRGLLQFRSTKTYNPYRCDCLFSPSFAFAPNGLVYPCLIMANACLSVGKYRDKVMLDNELIAKLRKRNIFDMPQCSQCNRRLFCYGGCPATSIMHGRDLFSSNCGFWKDIRIINSIESIIY